MLGRRSRRGRGPRRRRRARSPACSATRSLVRGSRCGSRLRARRPRRATVGRRGRGRLHLRRRRPPDAVAVAAAGAGVRMRHCTVNGTEPRRRAAWPARRRLPPDRPRLRPARPRLGCATASRRGPAAPRSPSAASRATCRSHPYARTIPTTCPGRQQSSGAPARPRASRRSRPARTTTAPPAPPSSTCRADDFLPLALAPFHVDRTAADLRPYPPEVRCEGLHLSQATFDERAASPASASDGPGPTRLRRQRTGRARSRPTPGGAVGDLAEGSPDDGFRVTEPICSTRSLSLDGLGRHRPRGRRRAGDHPELGLARRDPDSLAPRVAHPRPHRRARRSPSRRPAPPSGAPAPPSGSTYSRPPSCSRSASTGPPTDDESSMCVVALDSDGDRARRRRCIAPRLGAVQASARGSPSSSRRRLAPPAARATGADATLVLGRLGPARPAASGDRRRRRAARRRRRARRGRPRRPRRRRHGHRAPAGSSCAACGPSSSTTGATPCSPTCRTRPIVRPPDSRDAGHGDGSPCHHLVFASTSVRRRRPRLPGPRFLAEPALGGEETAFRTRKVTQIRAAAGAAGRLRAAALADRRRAADDERAGRLAPRPVPRRRSGTPAVTGACTPPTLTTGEGYRGRTTSTSGSRCWSSRTARQPGSSAGPGTTPRTSPHWSWTRSRARSPCSSRPRTRAPSPPAACGDRGRRSRLDPARAEHRRAGPAPLRAVNSATGELELEPGPPGRLTPDPLPWAGRCPDRLPRCRTRPRYGAGTVSTAC